MNTKTTFNVQGMSCSSCVRHINQALQNLEGVAAVHVDLAGAKVAVEYDAAKITADKLSASIRDAGYEVL